jgi:uncharacterized protein
MRFIGKCLLIKKKKVKVLVIGDMHLGIGGRFRVEGVRIGKGVLDENIKYLKEVIIKTGKLDKIVILGDLKTSFEGVEIEERAEICNLLEFLGKKCEQIIIIKGNHDNYLFNLIRNFKNVRLLDYFLWEEYAFLHGDKDFLEIYDKNTTYWVVGHAHPAIRISDGNKIEKYKCFLKGKYGKKNVIIVPSFSEASIGQDIIYGKTNLAWKMEINDFEIYVVEGFTTLRFGKLKRCLE